MKYYDRYIKEFPLQEKMDHHLQILFILENLNVEFTVFTNDTNYLDKLKNLGIDLYSYSHINMDPVRLTGDDDIKGIIEVSEIIDSSENALFNYISLSTTIDERIKMSFHKENASEKEIKDMVNNFHQTLGEDYYNRKEFNSEDLNKIKNKAQASLRRWYDENGYQISLGYRYNDKIILIFID